jgi:hypothetical protein
MAFSPINLSKFIRVILALQSRSVDGFSLMPKKTAQELYS